MIINVPIDEESTFQAGVELVFQLEGYKTEDTGGKTVYGISEKAHPDAVKKMWEAEPKAAKEIAKEIYHREYFKPILDFLKNHQQYFDGTHFPVVVEGFVIAAFDTAVNCGVGKTKKWISELSKDLCSMSMKTERLLWKRLYHYLYLSQKSRRYTKYFLGWINRLKKVREFIKSYTNKGGKHK